MGGAALSLEPGGQFELSGAPMTHVHETCDEAEHASPSGARGLRGNRRRLSRCRLCADLDARRNAGDAEGPLRDHARLHAEGRRLWAGDDVPDLHGPGQFRFRLRSRHGEEIPRGARAAAGRDRALRQFAVPRGQAERLPVLSQPHLDRCRQCARRHAALRVRGRLRLRALCRLRARCADVFRLSRRPLYRCRRQIVPRFPGGKDSRARRASRR